MHVYLASFVPQKVLHCPPTLSPLLANCVFFNQSFNLSQ